MFPVIETKFAARDHENPVRYGHLRTRIATFTTSMGSDTFSNPISITASQVWDSIPANKELYEWLDESNISVFWTYLKDAVTSELIHVFYADFTPEQLTWYTLKFSERQ